MPTFGPHHVIHKVVHRRIKTVAVGVSKGGIVGQAVIVQSANQNHGRGGIPGESETLSSQTPAEIVNKCRPEDRRTPDRKSAAIVSCHFDWGGARQIRRVDRRHLILESATPEDAMAAAAVKFVIHPSDVVVVVTGCRIAEAVADKIEAVSLGEIIGVGEAVEVFITTELS